jgi:hypothetical protein
MGVYYAREDYFFRDVQYTASIRTLAWLENPEHLPLMNNDIHSTYAMSRYYDLATSHP